MHPRRPSPSSSLAVLLVLAAGLLPLHAQEDFCHSPIGESRLLTPGTATCEVVGGATIVSLSDNTEVSWDTISLTSGRRLEFIFDNPDHTVVNRSLGTAVFEGTPFAKPTLLAGTLASNGNVVILSPDSQLLISEGADVEAASFVASGLDATSGQFFEGLRALRFDATEKSNPTTFVAGEIRTTRGEIILVGKNIDLTARLDAAGPVTVATGQSVEVAPDRSATTTGSQGQIVQGGVIEAAGDIAFVSQLSARLGGAWTAGNGRGRAYVRVNEGGEIRIGAGGLTVRGVAEFSDPPLGEVLVIGPDEGDNPGAVSPAVNEFPALGARKRSTPARPTSSAITARAGTGFTAQPSRKVQRPPALARTTVAPLRKRSFFRTRATLTRKRD